MEAPARSAKAPVSTIPANTHDNIFGTGRAKSPRMPTSEPSGVATALTQINAETRRPAGQATETAAQQRRLSPMNPTDKFKRVDGLEKELMVRKWTSMSTNTMSVSSQLLHMEKNQIESSLNRCPSTTRGES